MVRQWSYTSLTEHSGAHLTHLPPGGSYAPRPTRFEGLLFVTLPVVVAVLPADEVASHLSQLGPFLV